MSYTPNILSKDELYETAVIAGHEKYTINMAGNVYNRHGKLITPCINSSGYYLVSLSKNNKRKNLYLHRIIAIAFIPNPNNLSQINHKNGIKTDNRLENLEWCTAKHNIIHSWETGLSKPRLVEKGSMDGLKNPYATRVININTGIISTVKDAAIQIGISRSYLSSILSGRRNRIVPYKIIE